jgi:hypothetical protein|tara:strand:+ start:586 stop:780 length:195 start_codon:yes stop_codon:yes gene_type:complete
MINLDYARISDVEVEGIDTADYPDFCDAFIASADYDGREMTDEELDTLNDDSDFVYSSVQTHLY